MFPFAVRDAFPDSPTRLLRHASVLCALLMCLSGAAPSQQTSVSVRGAAPTTPALPRTDGAAGVAPAEATGVIRGTVKDATGATLAGAMVQLTVEGQASPISALTEADGAFVLPRTAAGAYTLRVSAPGLETYTSAGRLEPGESLFVPEIALAMAATRADMEVSVSRTEVAEAQVEMQEKQRVLGVFPNFYASYVWDAAPLTKRQKYRLAWRFSVDPVNVLMAGAIAGTEQSQNGFSGYGQGAQGYAKRFSATYADGLTSTLLGQAVLPALLHQDPRYFVKGTGSVRGRAEYALAMTVMCRGDSGRWQVNASNILGNVASASLSNVYYPASNRHGALLTVQNSLISTAAGALGNLLQEFMLRKMTPDVPDYGAAR